MRRRPIVTTNPHHAELQTFHAEHSVWSALDSVRNHKPRPPISGVPPSGRTRLLCGQGVGGVTVVILPFDW